MDWALVSRVEESHWWFKGRRRILSDLAQTFLPDTRPLQVLDVGCGTGSNLEWLKPLGPVIGIDSSPEAVAWSQAKRYDQVLVGDAAHLPLEDGVIDLVVALDVLEHIDDDRGAALELFRVLKPGGLLMVTVPAYRFFWSDFDVQSGHLRRYKMRELLHTIKRTGGFILKASYFNTLLFPLAAAVRLLGGRVFRGRSLQVELQPPFWMVNRFFAWVFSLEVYLVRVLRLPFGLSIVCVAQKRL